MKGLLIGLFVSLFAVTGFAEIKTETKIQNLKNQIVSLSLENMKNVETREVVRKELDPLVAELNQLAGPVTERTWFEFAPGGWQQVWSDERDNSPPNAPAQDLTQIYQFISVEGWGFNFGERKITEDQSVTFALAVVGSISENQQTTEITKAYLRPSPLLKEESLADLSNKIKAGVESGFTERELGKFPNGPIGAKGVLSLQFLDKDLKIGYAPNVYTGKVELFVLRRTDVVIK